jgi:5-methylcytosine-specific restriction protein A
VTWETRVIYNRRWRKIRRQVLDRDRWKCQIRGPRCRGTATTVDHIVPWRDGGAIYDPRNLRAACRECNFGHRQPKDERRSSRSW